MSIKRCSHCLEMRDLTEFGMREPKGNTGTLMLDSEEPFTERVRHPRSICRDCNSRRLRYRRGTQTQEDVVAEIKATLVREDLEVGQMARRERFIHPSSGN